MTDDDDHDDVEPDSLTADELDMLVDAGASAALIAVAEADRESIGRGPNFPRGDLLHALREQGITDAEELREWFRRQSSHHKDLWDGNIYAAMYDTDYELRMVLQELLSEQMIVGLAMSEGELPARHARDLAAHWYG